MIASGERRGEKRGEIRGEKRGEERGRKEGMRNGFLLAAKCLKKREEGKNDEEIARECECSIEDVKLFFSAMA